MLVSRLQKGIQFLRRPIALNFNTNQQITGGDLIEIKTPPFNNYNVSPLSSPTQLCAPISTKSNSPSPKIEKSDSTIQTPAIFYVGQKLKYTSNVTTIIDDVFVLSIHNIT